MFWKLTIIISIAIFAGCNSINSKSNEVSIQSNQTNNNSEKKEVGFLSEPVEYPFNKVPEDLKPIWDEFIKNGQ
ncbi:MAG: hypothetical protein LUM44_07590 [Pyrinomonadaceae bacterium]|nr:hypothetical protein [Pyrinomonadaceae bacterium]